MKENLILIGLMGAGKTSTGRVLARVTGRRFVDLDLVIATRAGAAIADIFAREGEAGFRAREAAALREVCVRQGQVIATGGGAPCQPDNGAALRAAGTVFWLEAPPEELARRVGREGAGRPLVDGAADLAARLEGLLQVRAPYYAACAHHRIDTAGRSPEQVAELVLAAGGPEGKRKCRG